MRQHEEEEEEEESEREKNQCAKTKNRVHSLIWFVFGSEPLTEKHYFC